MPEVAKIDPAKARRSDAALAGSPAREASVQPLPVPPAQGFAPSLERKRLQVFVLMMAIDVAILLASFASVGFAYLIVYLGQYEAATAMLPAYLLLPIFLTIGLFNSTYAGSSLVSWKRATWRGASALVIAAALLNFVAFFAKMNADFSRAAFAISVIMTIVLMGVSRAILVKWVRRIWGESPMNRLIIQAGGPGISLPEAFTIEASEHGLRPQIDDPAALDRLGKYIRNMDQVLVSCPDPDRKAWSQVLRGAGIHAEVVSEFAMEVGALGIRHYEDAAFSTLQVSRGPLRTRDRALKRLFDIFVSLIAIIVFSPIMALAALAIVIEDGGPVLFRQRRMGRSNKFFDILKFRSMRQDRADANGDRSTDRDDDRITRVGRFIRRTSIDELPQLFNVLHGDMSLVGPRPHALGSQAGEKLYWQVDQRYWLRHTLRPGITGLAQVRGFRGSTHLESDLENRLRSDLEYLSGWSLWRDVAIIFSTLRVLVHDKAY